jgi:hypothetical protein
MKSNRALHILAIGGSSFAVRLVQADVLPSSAPLVFDGAKYDRTMASKYEEKRPNDELNEATRPCVAWRCER